MSQERLRKVAQMVRISSETVALLLTSSPQDIVDLRPSAVTFDSFEDNLIENQTELQETLNCLIDAHRRLIRLGCYKRTPSESASQDG